MKKYVDYLGTQADNFILSHCLGDWYDYGDHPAGYSKNTPIEVSATSHRSRKHARNHHHAQRRKTRNGFRRVYIRLKICIIRR